MVLRLAQAQRTRQHNYSDQCLQGDFDEQRLEHTTSADQGNYWKLLAMLHALAAMNAGNYLTTQKQTTGKKNRAQEGENQQEKKKERKHHAPHEEEWEEQQQERKRGSLAQGAQAENKRERDDTPLDLKSCPLPCHPGAPQPGQPPHAQPH